MKFQPKVSILIITYNQEDLISETIESALKQDYDNYEIIVADDASTDKTREIINFYAKKFPEKIIPVFNEKNLGITGNCNAAFFAATGDLIAFLGGDDLFLPNKIKNQVEKFEDVSVVLSYHSVEIFDHLTGSTLFITNTTKNEDLNNAYEIISKGGIPGASSVMVRRSACPEFGFNPKFPVVSDWLFFIEVAMQGRIEKLEGVYAKYRKHGKGASERSFKLLDETLSVLVEIKNIYPKDLILEKACQQGGYRYLLGELFRQIQKKDKAKISIVLNKAYDYCTGKKLIFLRILSKILQFDFSLKFTAWSTALMKNYLKKKA